MSYTAIILIQLGSSDTGLTLSAKLYDSSNVQQGSTITTGFAELGNGEYQWVVSLDESFRGTARFYSGGGSTYQTSLPINGALSYLIAVKGKTDLLGVEDVEFVNPLVESGTLTITRGDDYLANLGNQPAWTSDAWPELAAASVYFRAKHRWTGEYIDPIECEVSVGGLSGEQVIAVSLPTLVTSGLSIGEGVYLFDLQATIDDAHLTLISGEMTVREDYVDAR